MKNLKLLLVENNKTYSIESTIKQSLQIRKIKIINDEEIEEELSTLNYDFVFVNAISMSDIIKVVKKIKQINPELILFVFTSSPTADIARNVLLAGANDYIVLEDNEEGIREILKEAIDRYEER
jgi:DNA-binding NarL/FixJ family response regulator